MLLTIIATIIMIIDNDKIFQTEDIDDVQELYDDWTRSFSEHTYMNYKYEKLFDEIWGIGQGLETFNAIYGCNNWRQFKKDYSVELQEFNEK